MMPHRSTLHRDCKLTNLQCRDVLKTRPIVSTNHSRTYRAEHYCTEPLFLQHQSENRQGVDVGKSRARNCDLARLLDAELSIQPHHSCGRFFDRCRVLFDRHNLVVRSMNDVNGYFLRRQNAHPRHRVEVCSATLELFGSQSISTSSPSNSGVGREIVNRIDSAQPSNSVRILQCPTANPKTTSTSSQ